MQDGGTKYLSVDFFLASPCFHFAHSTTSTLDGHELEMCHLKERILQSELCSRHRILQSSLVRLFDHFRILVYTLPIPRQALLTVYGTVN